jgi:hypothetical protein
MRWLFLLSFFICQIDKIHRYGKIKGGIYMRKKDFKTKQTEARNFGQSVMTFFRQKGLTKRAAALMMVCTLILTMTPVTANGDDSAVSTNEQAESNLTGTDAPGTDPADNNPTGTDSNGTNDSGIPEDAIEIVTTEGTVEGGNDSSDTTDDTEENKNSDEELEDNVVIVDPIPEPEPEDEDTSDEETEEPQDGAEEEATVEVDIKAIIEKGDYERLLSYYDVDQLVELVEDELTDSQYDGVEITEALVKGILDEWLMSLEDDTVGLYDMTNLIVNPDSTDVDSVNVFTTFSDAVTAAQDNVETTITLAGTNNVITTDTVSISSNKKIVLNLNNHTLQGTDNASFVLIVWGKLTVQDNTATLSVDAAGNVTYSGGKISGKKDTIAVAGGAVFTLQSGEIYSASNIGIYIQGNRSAIENSDGSTNITSSISSTVNIDGGYVYSEQYGIVPAGKGATLIVNSGVVFGKNAFGISGNGTNNVSDYQGETAITINGGTIINGPNTTGWMACGIYHPQKGTLTINGGKIIAKNGVGVLMRGGTLTMKGGSIHASGTISGTIADSKVSKLNCSGIVVDGACGYYDIENCKVEIGGSTSINTNSGVSTMYVISDTTKGIEIKDATFSGDLADGYKECYTGTQYEVSAVNATCSSHTDVAQIGEKNIYYSNLQQAVNDAAQGATIKLLNDTKEDIVVPSGKKITLNLNGKNITNQSSHTIKVKWNATIEIIGSGKVDNITNGCAAVYNNGTAILSGGTYDRTKEDSTGKEKSEKGTNTYYTILNHGIMTVNEGAVVQTANRSETYGRHSSLFANGYKSFTDSSDELQGYISGTNLQYPTLTISGGKFYGGLNTIKNDDNGILTILDGTFANYYQAVLQNHHIAEVRGGTFTANANSGYDTYGIMNCGCDDIHDFGKLTVSGGTFKGKYAIYDCGYVDTTITISGGTFTGTENALWIRDYDATHANHTTIKISENNPTVFESTGTTNGTAQSGYTIYDGSTSHPNIMIFGGTFKGSNGVLYTAGNTKYYFAISGGTFHITDEGYTNTLLKYVEDGYSGTRQAENIYVVSAGDNAVASIGNSKFASLAYAVKVAEVGSTIKLLADINESITVPSGKNITLDLNGHNITNEAGEHTITVDLDGTLTVTGDGTVDNISDGRAAVYNNGTTTLNGGTYDRTKETGTSKTEKGENSWYTICNHGVMTVTDGAIVQTAAKSSTLGKFSSLFENGYSSYNAKEGVTPSGLTNYIEGIGQQNPSLTINGGSFYGGLNTIKNDDNATIVINDGTFANYYQAVVQNHNVATINGGTFTANASSEYVTYGIYNCGCDSTYDKGQLTVTGGTFTGATYGIADVSDYTGAYVKVTGGTFEGASSAVIVSDRNPSKNKYNHTTVTISGTETTGPVFTDKNGYAIWDNSTTNPLIVISGGTFTGSKGALYSIDKRAAGDTTGNPIGYSVTGGKFSSIVIEDFISQENIDSGIAGDERICKLDSEENLYVIMLKSDANDGLEVIPVIAPSAVDTSSLKNEESEAAKAIVATAQTVEVLGLAQAARSNAEEVSDSDNEKQKELKNATSAKSDDLVQQVNGYSNDSGEETDPDSPKDPDNIQIISKVYTEITPKSYSTTDGEVKYELIITPRVQYIAATGNVTEDNIKNEQFAENETGTVKSITVESGTNGAEAKKGGAVLLADEKLTVTTNTTITVPVPSGIVEKSGEGMSAGKRNLIVKHELSNSNAVKYYKAEVGTKTTAAGASYSYYDVTFNNPDGFSTFTIEEDPGDLKDLTIGAATTTYTVENIGDLLPTTDANGKNVSGWKFEGIAGTFKTMTYELYTALIQLQKEPDATITASAVPVKTTNPTNTNSNKKTDKDSTQTDAADATTDTVADTNAAVDANASQTTNAAAGTGSAADTTAQNGTDGTSQNREVTIVDPEVGEEEEQVAQIEESVVTEEVAEVEGGDLTADEADGGVIVETVGNSSNTWIWLLVVLACAAAAILLLIVFKRRKDENA